MSDSGAWRASSPGTPPGGPAMNSNRWRTVDIVVAAILAIAFGVVFYAWDRLWAGTDNLFAGFGPARAVIAGGGGWLLTRALARTGVLDRFPSGRERVAV